MIHIGGAKVPNKIIHKRKCHFGATYMDGGSGDPPFLSKIFKQDLVIKACTRFNEIHSVGYFF